MILVGPTRFVILLLQQQAELDYMDHSWLHGSGQASIQSELEQEHSSIHIDSRIRILSLRFPVGLNRGGRSWRSEISRESTQSEQVWAHRSTRCHKNRCLLVEPMDDRTCSLAHLAHPVHLHKIVVLAGWPNRVVKTRLPRHRSTFHPLHLVPHRYAAVE
jgi:hypothetical protein